LGTLYEKGKEGAPLSYLKALRWYSKAYNQGHPISLNTRGVLYELAKDYKKAIKCYEKVRKDAPSYKDRAVARLNLALNYSLARDGFSKENSQEEIKDLLASVTSPIGLKWVALRRSLLEKDPMSEWFLNIFKGYFEDRHK
jgi:TPR repeat protein